MPLFVTQHLRRKLNFRVPSDLTYTNQRHLNSKYKKRPTPAPNPILQLYPTSNRPKLLKSLNIRQNGHCNNSPRTGPSPLLLNPPRLSTLPNLHRHKSHFQTPPASSLYQSSKDPLPYFLPRPSPSPPPHSHHTPTVRCSLTYRA